MIDETHVSVSVERGLTDVVFSATDHPALARTATLWKITGANPKSP
jgi:hypothetical protein